MTQGVTKDVPRDVMENRFEAELHSGSGFYIPAPLRGGRLEM